MGHTEVDIEKHFQLELEGFKPGCKHYLLHCGMSKITIRSQQMRAMNLVWSLHEKIQSEKPNVAVIGGGAAGLTFAAAAAVLGANVELYESSSLMHLQVGCWHRPLHPEIYTWPEDTAYRPVSHLPLLGWTTGSAHAVATEIVSKFRVIQKHLGKDRLKVLPKRATLNAKGALHVVGSKVAPRRQEMIVLAVGFGVEDSPAALALNSYWRVDALNQSFLEEDNPTVVVTGSGDGALIEILRCCVLETDQGPFLDKILMLTLRDQKLLKAIKKIEKKGTNVWSAYKNLRKEVYPSLKEIDKFLENRKRNISVRWLCDKKTPFETPSLPINRFLVARLAALDFDLTLCSPTKILAVSPTNKGRYVVEYTWGKSSPQHILCHLALIRWGPMRYEAQTDRARRLYPHLLRSVAGVFDNPTPEILHKLNERLDPKGSDHSDCHLPCWEIDAPFKKLLDESPSKSLKRPRLLAEFIQAFDSPDSRYPEAPIVYRLRIWLKGVCKHLTVTYDLHPEENKAISRFSLPDNLHEQWINTRNDYTIRVRMSDGSEWYVGRVSKALERGARSTSIEEQRKPSLPIKRKDGSSAAPQSFEAARERLAQQSKHIADVKIQGRMKP